MKICFYRSPAPSWEDWQTKFASRIINWFTGVRGFWHCELVFSDGRSFTSMTNGGAMFFNRPHPEENWVSFDLPATPEQEGKMSVLATSKLGTPYDFLGAVGIVLPWAKYDRKKAFCSEICVEVLQEMDLFVDYPPYQISPNFLYEAFLFEKFTISTESV